MLCSGNYSNLEGVDNNKGGRVKCPSNEHTEQIHPNETDTNCR